MVRGVAVELPDDLAQLLQFVGIPWINVNEDKVREFATHVRTFASKASNTHQDAEATLRSLGTGYQGAAYEAIMRMWGSKSGHLTDVIDACGVLATALDVAAGFIEGRKMYCIGQLGVMAAEFVADQAAAVATLGLAEAALPVIEETTTQVMKFAVQEVEDHVTGEILGKAMQPLMGKLDDMATGLLLEAGGGPATPGTGFKVDPNHLAAHAEKMGAHADDATGHVTEFMSNLGSVDFNS